MKIEDISIFGEYKQPENRVTSAFLQICKIGGEDFIRYLTTELNIQLPSSEIAIHSQAKNDVGVPDGLLLSNFSFKLLVESKIKNNSVDVSQLERHKTQVKTSNDFLLYLTPDEIKPKQLRKIHWANWLQIINIFNDYLQTSQSDNKQLLEFLIVHFNTLLDNLNLLGFNWDLNNDKVIIVAGSWAEGIALNYNFYMCQNKRTFKSARYLAFYNNSQIRHVFEILEKPIDNVDLTKHSEFKNYVEQAEPNYEGLRKVFKLKLIQNIGPIINDKIDKNGNLCPFTYGQPRYTDLNTLLKVVRTSQI
jgi:hypothetical protein